MTPAQNELDSLYALCRSSEGSEYFITRLMRLKALRRSIATWVGDDENILRRAVDEYLEEHLLESNLRR